ncbi:MULTISPECIES: RNA polymerase sigma factor [unclassified Flavobacterium]|uniref:Sigma-70 family RNA polymerase sigma factor n=1 Tax=Paenimyroides aestuarii TaxID=2968490 RepID=A0ABY5NW32_9FLAO|nr:MULTISPECIES: sigma-70 family RNA polymerase sigma factor [unclassified Flavobacterium]UUV22796.1 sigma-70 family RNA polymerase sigma factor [Paenimyroides aestuarii]
MYSEEDLVVLLKQKSEAAFNHLYSHYCGALYGVVLRIVSSKEYTEEVIQDVFVKIWNGIGQYDESKGRLYTWMINIARNTAIDYLKSKSFQNQLKNQSVTDVVYALKEDTINTADFIGFAKVLDQLDADKKELIILAYYQGYTQVEISEKLSIPLGTVKTKMRSTLLKLKELLKEYQ